MQNLDDRFGPLEFPIYFRPLEDIVVYREIHEVNDMTIRSLNSTAELLKIGQILSAGADRLTFLWAVDADGAIRITLECVATPLNEFGPRLRGIPAEIPWHALGHPALLAGGPGRIAGELYIDTGDEEWRWVLNNKSGRYSTQASRRPEHLVNVAAVFASWGLMVHTDFR